MFRLVSLFGMVALCVAAAALANQAKKNGKAPHPEKHTDDSQPRVPALPEVSRLKFHARFSLN
jgi:hypothetical protein